MPQAKITPKWTFLDYVDRTGVNRISEWLQSIPIDARVEFEVLLDMLRGKCILTRPETGKLYKALDGLYEFVFKVSNVQYRPIFCYGPDTKAREITILVGATKKNNRFIPAGVGITAMSRAKEIWAGDRKKVVRHVRIS
ncbi:MAG: type II toxin-antitoxin system RelE/ParE family toxin [Dehalococcoidia bacterium]|jgi:hypothetical protein